MLSHWYILSLNTPVLCGTCTRRSTCDLDRIDKVQPRAARFTLHGHKSRRHPVSARSCCRTPPKISSGPATVACDHFQQLPARAWTGKETFHFKRIVCRTDDPNWCAFCSLVFFFCSSFWVFSSLSQPSKMTEWWIILTVVTFRTMNLSLSFCVCLSVSLLFFLSFSNCLGLCFLQIWVSVRTV